MKTALRLVALAFLVAIVADVYALARHNIPLLVAGCAFVAAAAGWRDAVVLPVAVLTGGLYLTALLVGHVPYDAGAVVVGIALLGYVDLSVWSAATPRHTSVPAGSLARLASLELLALGVGAGMALLVVVGRSQASRASIVPWLAGLAMFSVAVLVPVLRGAGRQKS